MQNNNKVMHNTVLVLQLSGLWTCFVLEFNMARMVQAAWVLEDMGGLDGCVLLDGAVSCFWMSS